MTTTETPTYSLHPDTGRFLVDGVQLPLQQKAQQVLSRIAASAPAMVLRHELIDEVWAGNYLTGEKGLRQALEKTKKDLRTGDCRGLLQVLR